MYTPNGYPQNGEEDISADESVRKVIFCRYAINKINYLRVEKSPK
jgi:hypothetical protein